MVYLLRAQTVPTPRGLVLEVWPDRPTLLGRCIDTTAAEVRLLARYCLHVHTVRLAGRDWWYGSLLEIDAARLAAAGRVRAVTVAELLHVAGGLVAGDDLVIR